MVWPNMLSTKRYQNHPKGCPSLKLQEHFDFTYSCFLVNDLQTAVIKLSFRFPLLSVRQTCVKKKHVKKHTRVPINLPNPFRSLSPHVRKLYGPKQESTPSENINKQPLSYPIVSRIKGLFESLRANQWNRSVFI